MIDVVVSEESDFEGLFRLAFLGIFDLRGWGLIKCYNFYNISSFIVSVLVG